MSITYKELQEAMVGNRLSLGKLYKGVAAADSVANLPAGAIARAKSDGTTEAGPYDITVANDFDPGVTGYEAPLRSTMISQDGTKSFVKVGAANTDWISTARKICTVTAQADTPALDCAISLGADECAIVDIYVAQMAVGATWALMRVNGNTITNPRGIFQISGAFSMNPAPYLALCLSTATWGRATWRIGKSIAGVRHSEVSTTCGYTGGFAYNGIGNCSFEAGELTSIGLGITTATNIVGTGSRIDILAGKGLLR